jgi:hypothetical protein
MCTQVLAFFSARLEQHPEQTLSVQVVLDVIKQGALQWPRDRLKVSGQFVIISSTIEISNRKNLF